MMYQLLSAIRRRLNPPKETISGYEHPDIIEAHFQKTKAYEPKEPWPEMMEVSSVLDFGGACGIHYKRAALQNPSVRWAVVETPAMASRASEIATNSLRFFTSISEAAAWLGPIDVMHSNGALQYVPDPMTTLRLLCSLRSKTMLWYRLFLTDGGCMSEMQTSHLIDNGPGRAPLGIDNKIVQYERIGLPETEFVDAHTGYTLITRRENSFRFKLTSSM